jgi:hypothetical protein
MGFRTQTQVDRLRLPAGKSDVYIFDDEVTGLSVRIQGQARRWVVWYQANGVRRRMTLGDVASLPLREARHKAGRIVSDAREGKDALGARETARAASADTLGALITTYLEQGAKVKHRPSTYAEVERHLMKRWAPLHERPLAGLSARDIDARLHELAGEYGPGSAAKARMYLSGMFAWAMRKPRLGVDRNPAIGTEAPEYEARTGRALSPVELKAIWRACEAFGEFGAIVRLAMLTGARRTEVADLPWSEIDLDRVIWTLPARGRRTARRC